MAHLRRENAGAKGKTLERSEKIVDTKEMLHIVIALFLGNFPAQASIWDDLLNPNGNSPVVFGVSLLGPSPFEKRGDQLFAPASVSKIFTTGLALDRLGPNYRYKTTLSWSSPSPGVAVDVVLTGSGDPSWGMTELGEDTGTRFRKLAKAMVEKGITRIEGRVEAVSLHPELDTLRFPEGWKADDATTCGGALAQSFNLSVNCAVLQIKGKQIGWNKPGIPTPVIYSARSGEKTSLRLQFEKIGGRWGYRVSGTVKENETESFYVPVWDVKGWARNLLVLELKKAGITYDSLVNQRGGKQDEVEILSPPLSEIIKPFMKNSINVMGDAILKTVAVEQAERDRDPLTGGLLLLKEHLSNLGLKNFTLNDGAGLSRTSRITPNNVRLFLEKMRDEREFPAFWNSLAIAGVDGTLSGRMKETVAKGKLRAKTGTLDGVYNLAGYVPSSRGYMPFVVISATKVQFRQEARAAADRIGVQMAKNSDTAILLSQPSHEKTIPYLPENAGFDGQ